MIGGTLMKIRTMMKINMILLTAFVIALPFGTGAGGSKSGEDSSDHPGNQLWIGQTGIPVIMNDTNTTVLASVGQVSYLHCHIENLGDRSVSWIRSRDLTILTIGMIRYTRDQRFTAIHAQNSDYWALKIINPQLEDSGVYECQVSYHDDVENKLKMPFTLTVLDTRAKIRGSPELFMKEGSRVVIECGLEEVSTPPAYIYWYRGEHVVNYDNKHGITVSLRKQEHSVISQLVIQSAAPKDSGNYTCAPANAVWDSVILHVIEGEKRAGLQEISSLGISSLRPGSLSCFLLLLLLLPLS